MSKRVLFTVTADWHLHDWGEFNSPPSVAGMSPRLIMQLERLMFWLSDQDLTEDTLGIVLGDVVQRRSPMIAHEVVTGLSDMAKNLAERFKHSMVLAGNHDFPQDRATYLSAALHLKSGRVSYAHLPYTWSRIGGRDSDLSAAFLPWGKYTPEELRQAVQKLNDSLPSTTRKVLFTHFPTREAVSENGRSGFGKYSVEDFLPDRWDLIVSGDIHKHQAISGKFVYVGAPYQLTRGDSGDETKGYLVIYDDLTWEHRKITSPTMRHISLLVGGTPDFSKFSNEDMATIQVKRGTVPFEEVQEAARKYFKLPPVVTWEDLESSSKKDKVRALPKGTTPENPESILKAYLDTRYSGKLDKEVLFDCGQVLLEKAGASVEAYTGVVTFERIVAHNFMAYRELDVPLEGQGIVLVDGRNDDAHEVFRANAVGKSSLLEAIHFGLYGKTVRGQKDSDLPNRDSGEDWFSVELHLRTSRHKIRILRTRNSKEYGSGVQLFLDDSPYSSEGRKKDESTENQIWKEIGISSRLFRSAVMFGQNIQTLFAAGTDKDRKEILSELFAIDAYVRAEEFTSEELDRVTASLTKSKLRLETVRAFITVKSKSLTDARTNAELSRADRDRRLDELYRLMGTTSESLTLLEATPLTSPTPVRQVELLDDKQLLDLKSKESTLLIRRGTLTGKQEQLRRQEVEWANLAKEGVCPICKGAITQEKHEHAMAPIKRDLTLAVREFAPIEEELAKIRTSIAQESIRLNAHRDKERERVALETREFNLALAEVESKRNQISTLRSRLDDLSRERDRLVKEPEPFASMIEGIEKEIKELGLEENALVETILRDDEEIPYLTTLKTLFGKQGLRTFVFDYYSAEIEKQANDALQVLTDGIYQLGLGAKKGVTTIKESLGFDVFKSGALVPYVSLSGAERRMVDLGLLWALFSMLNRVNILVEDEALDVLDDAAAPRTFELLRQAANQKGCTVFCITHRADIKPLCENVWTVVMSGQSARVLQGNEA